MDADGFENDRIARVKDRILAPSMIHELLLSPTETASGSHPCCVVSVTYHRPSSFTTILGHRATSRTRWPITRGQPAGSQGCAGSEGYSFAPVQSGTI